MTTTLTLATENLHWPNTDAENDADIDAVKGDVQVVLFQEVYHSPVKHHLGAGWDALDSDAGGKRDIAVGWRTGAVRVIASGFKQIGHMEHGSHKTFAVAWIETEDVILGSVHPPHGKYERENPGIKAECFDGIEAWVKTLHKPWVIGGDWNESIVGRDPFNIAKRTGATWHGGGSRRIDGFLASAGILVRDVHDRDAGIRSDHPVVFATIAASVDRPDPQPAPEGDAPARRWPPRLAACNIKGGMSRWGGLYRGTRGTLRMCRCIRRLNGRAASIAALSEAGTAQVMHVEDHHPRWDTYAATPFFHRGSWGKGVALVWRRDVWAKVETFQIAARLPRPEAQGKDRWDIAFRLPEHNVVSYPVALLRHKRTDREVLVIGYHGQPAGRKPDAQYLRGFCEAAVRDFVNEFLTSHPGVRVVVAGDANNPRIFPAWRGVRHRVDVVLSPNAKVTDPVVDEAFRGLVSDHASPSGRLR